MDKPVIWLYYDTSDVNARRWSDFGARSSRALNLPFLNLCYESIVKQNKELYRIEVIGGLSGAAELLGGWNHLPPGLRDPISPVNETELNYLRTAILAKYGGLWLSPYCVSLKPFGKLPEDKTVFLERTSMKPMRAPQEPISLVSAPYGHQNRTTQCLTNGPLCAMIALRISAAATRFAVMSSGISYVSQYLCPIRYHCGSRSRGNA